MTYVKIGASILLILFMIASAFFLRVLDGVKGLVTESNTGFIALLPQEAIWIISMIFFAFMLALAYLLFRE